MGMVAGLRAQGKKKGKRLAASGVGKNRRD